MDWKQSYHPRYGVHLSANTGHMGLGIFYIKPLNMMIFPGMSLGICPIYSEKLHKICITKYTFLLEKCLDSVK